MCTKVVQETVTVVYRGVCLDVFVLESPGSDICSAVQALAVLIINTE